MIPLIISGCSFDLDRTWPDASGSLDMAQADASALDADAAHDLPPGEDPPDQVSDVPPDTAPPVDRFPAPDMYQVPDLRPDIASHKPGTKCPCKLPLRCYKGVCRSPCKKPTDACKVVSNCPSNRHCLGGVYLCVPGAAPGKSCGSTLGCWNKYSCTSAKSGAPYTCKPICSKAGAACGSGSKGTCKWMVNNPKCHVCNTP